MPDIFIKYLSLLVYNTYESYLVKTVNISVKFYE